MDVPQASRCVCARAVAYIFTRLWRVMNKNKRRCWPRHLLLENVPILWPGTAMPCYLTAMPCCLTAMPCDFYSNTNIAYTWQCTYVPELMNVVFLVWGCVRRAMYPGGVHAARYVLGVLSARRSWSRLRAKKPLRKKRLYDIVSSSSEHIYSDTRCACSLSPPRVGRSGDGLFPRQSPH